MVRICPGATLPNTAANGITSKFFLLRAFGDAGPNESHQISDVTQPSKPKFLTTVISGLSRTRIKPGGNATPALPIWLQDRRSIGGSSPDPPQHIYVYDSSNPEKPVFIRQFGLPGQQPTASVATQQPCLNAPSDTCFEGTTIPRAACTDPFPWAQW